MRKEQERKWGKGGGVLKEMTRYCGRITLYRLVLFLFCFLHRQAVGVGGGGEILWDQVHPLQSPERPEPESNKRASKVDVV